MARVTLKEIERELRAQDDAWLQLRTRLTAQSDTQIVLGESFLEDMLAIDERVETPSCALLPLNRV